MILHETHIKICRSTLKIMKYSLIWPIEEEEMKPGKRYMVQIVTFLVITIFWVLSVFMHLIMTIKSHADVHISEDVGFSVAICGVYYMTILYVKNQPNIAMLLRDLSDFKKFGIPPGFEEENKKLGFWSQFCFYYTVIGLSIYNLTKLFTKAECERTNQEKGVEDNCGMMSPTWFPFKIDYFPVYYLAVFYVFISIQIFLKLALMISYNTLEIAHHVVLRINHLNMMITDCFEEEDSETSRKKFKKCVLYHLEILDVSSRLDKCFSNGMFGHLTMTAAICGCLEKQFLDGDSRIGAFIHVFGWIMALFVACMGGQHLIDAGMSITETVYSSKWYQADIKLRKDLLFMLIRSQKNLNITVGSFSILSFSLFVSVLKMSYSILAMLTK